MADPGPVTGWQARFDDDSVRSSRDTAWADLPADGLLVVTVFYAHKHHTGMRYRDKLSSYDRYGHDGASLFVGNNDSLGDNLARYPSILEASWKRGRWTDSEKMRAADLAANQDTSFD